MTVFYLWALFLVGLLLQVGAIAVSVRALGPLGLLLSVLVVIGAAMVALAFAWGILGELSRLGYPGRVV